DRPGTLFYLDPPYYGSEGDYGPIFDRSQFAMLAEALRRREGKFILSINDHPEVRRIFDGFTMEEVDTTYTLSGANKAKRVGELIITGG
ncbi:MAG: DNA adenine methylase, partial [Alphaproteobacteria bacterium]|nr:DNA adenine methylase [Alphaproteobacteria bacterium]